MAGSADSNNSAAWVACILVGLAALVAGFAWPYLAGSPSEEAKANVAEFLAAGKAMETASAQGQSRRDRRPTPEMAELRQRYQQAREKAQQSRAAPGRVAYWLKVAGALVAAIGCAGYFATGKR